MSNRKKEVHGDPYENLANAIILRAVWDYQAALRRYRRTFEVNDEMIRCEKFFRSSFLARQLPLTGMMNPFTFMQIVYKLFVWKRNSFLNLSGS